MKLDAATEAWEVEEAIRRRRQLFDPFSVPGLAELFHVRVGDRVELRLSFRGCDRHGPFLQVERHWLVVSQVSGERGTGILADDPACTGLLRAGDRIDFEYRHITAIQRAAA